MTKMSARRLIAALAILAGLIVSPAPGASAGHEGEPYFDLSGLPATDFTGKQIFDGLKQFATDFPLRITGTPNEIQAGLSIHDEMVDLGYEVETCSVPQSAVVVCRDDEIGAGLKAIVATKPGTTKPDESILFIGHYDTVPQTINGAYDNGSGTNFIEFLAKEFQNVQTNRTLKFVFFNGEEEGVLASGEYAQYLKDINEKVTAVLGFDMVGIAWPVATETSRSCLCMWHGANDRDLFDPVLRYVNYDFLGFPNHLNKVAIRGTNTRNSDESSFASAGFHTLRWAGMKSASNYVAYHKQNDTIETIIAEAGGETYYEQGIENTLKSVYYTALTLDNHSPVPSATITKDGLSIAADASGSSDPDGAVSGFSWDFGDGSSGEGVTVQHAYSSPGTYEVTLTVADNLWSQVTEAHTYTVTV